MQLKIVFLNCFLFQIHILLYNAFFFNKISRNLPSDEGLAPWLLRAENFFRCLVFFLPIFIPINTSASTYIPGLILCIGGSVIYFLSWIPLLMVQKFKNLLSKSISIFLGPFFSPILFLSGIALIGESLGYFFCSLLFILIHTRHGFLIYKCWVSPNN
jgi:hypothetical protein